MLAGFLLLVLFQLLGDVLAAWLGIPVPGAVLGMLLLVVALLLKARLGGADALQSATGQSLEQVSNGLVRYLSLFFLSAGIGIFFLPETFSGQWLPLLAVIVPGTVLTLLVTALLLQALLRGSK